MHDLARFFALCPDMLIVAGLRDEVVTQANFLVDSESRLKAAVAGMTSPDAGHPGPGAAPAPPVASPAAPPAHVHGQ